MAQQFDSDADARVAAGPDNSAVREVLDRLAGAVTAGDARAAARLWATPALVLGDGMAWSVVNANTTATLNDVAPLAANDVWVDGANGTLIHYDGATWDAVSATTATLTGAAVSEPDDVLIVGASGTILHLQP